MSETTPTNVITSLSIEETNRIRISLGLKPLKEESKEVKPQTTTNNNNNNNNTNSDTLEVLDTINRLKKKRELNSKLAGKSIAEQLLEGENEDEDDDISSWINKSRLNEKQKQIERKKELLNKKQQKQQQHYNQSNLKGMKVGNDIKYFEDENEHILTLQDSSVLEDSEDVLINVNLTEKEKREKQLQSNKKKSKFDRYDDFGEHKGGILSDYSDDDGDVVDNGFILGNDGKFDKDSSSIGQNGLSLKDQAKKNLESYNMEDNTTTSILSSFYTQEEMERFKKNRQSSSTTTKTGSSTAATATKGDKNKKKKLRKKSATRDLLNELDATTSSDLGSRSSKSVITEKEKKEIEEQSKREENYQRAKDKANEISKQTFSSDYYEEAEDEDFYKSLATAKKAPIFQKEKSIVDKIVNNKKKQDESLDHQNSTTNNLEEITINPTSEFVRSLNPEGLISNYRLTTTTTTTTTNNNKIDDNTVTSLSNENNNNNNDSDDNNNNSNNNNKDEEMKNIDDGDDDDDENEEDEDYNKYKEKEKKYNNLSAILPEEPLVSGSVSAALRLFAQKGDLQPNPVTNNRKRGINYDNDESTVIEHKDEFGRVMSRKEAFVKMSQVFHGKKSGKNKMEKRKRLYEEELKKMKMDSNDTPLGMVKSFQSYQEKTNSPYLVLSGGGGAANILKQNINNNQTTNKK
ncbi:SART-1 family protein [Dictyostelium discoideum AX4]|uniref:SART-1 family protein n=1 Tax=Dictyostelium discoideum TaxID=44689 RepID=Q54TQ2_DICDI|nr:SART-1 family protein [Dictyostelium discoideum AX4]EAL66572.1 SART-1 family protein [Dictyostelium discoideum AX4]|eukprot:XP_640539.1 SART-1 family protein [Dictyostelium discoideum AX4]